jgi:hypothetical protein
MTLNYSDDITLAELARLLAEDEKSTNGKIDSEEDEGEPEVSSAPPIQFVDEMEFYARKF